MRVSETLRDEVPGLKVVLHCGGGSFKSQFKKADKSGAEFGVIIGEDEAQKQLVSLKPLRSDDEQKNMSIDQLTTTLRQWKQS